MNHPRESDAVVAARPLASDRAYRHLRDGIIGGRFKPGQTVTEDELAGAVGVSRTPAREAIRRAHAEGLIDLEGFRRARVRQFSDKDIDDLMEIRGTLEALAAERAATRIGADEIAALEQLVEQMDVVLAEGGEAMLTRFAALNDAFHLGVLAASRSPQLQHTMGQIIEVPLIMLRRFEHSLDKYLQRTNRHHRDLLAAFRARDPKWAASEMTAHLLSARSTAL